MVVGYWLLVIGLLVTGCWLLVTRYSLTSFEGSLIPLWNSLTPLWGWGKGVRILMYHKFSTSETDFLTVTTAQFDEQLNYLQTNDYQFITIQQLIDFYKKNQPLPPRPVLLTFDDAYVSQLELAYPILQKYKAKATVFVPTAYIGQGSNWDEIASPIMSFEQLKNLPPSVFSLALHTHTHPNFKKLSLPEIEHDMDACLQYFTVHNLPFSPVLAYPYGARPKDAVILRGMKTYFQNCGIVFAFRIGNRINPLKVKDLYELNRIDIRGTDSFKQFKKKIILGKLHFI
jgi:peptidoglycan/xylan/chitin deacetylase (PgdA/CDA1 family)